jgi:hypothetical protein
MSWFNNYYLEITIPENKKMNDYILKLNNKLNKNVEHKIEEIEKEYLNKLNELEKLCNNLDKLKEYKSKNSLIILQKELDIIKLLTKYTLSNKNLNYTFFISCLNILLELSEVLRNRLGQKEISHDKLMNMNKKYENNILPRCSYKFCSYQDSCIYNYNNKKTNLCYQDHYVHNMVSADLKTLIKYINSINNNNNIILHNKEILKTINTLSYVICHMETELKTKCLYLPEKEWEKCHFVKNK